MTTASAHETTGKVYDAGRAPAWAQDLPTPRSRPLPLSTRQLQPRPGQLFYSKTRPNLFPAPSIAPGFAYRPRQLLDGDLFGSPYPVVVTGLPDLLCGQEYGWVLEKLGTAGFTGLEPVVAAAERAQGMCCGYVVLGFERLMDARECILCLPPGKGPIFAHASALLPPWDIGSLNTTSLAGATLMSLSLGLSPTPGGGLPLEGPFAPVYRTSDVQQPHMFPDIFRRFIPPPPVPYPSAPYPPPFASPPPPIGPLHPPYPIPASSPHRDTDPTGPPDRHPAAAAFSSSALDPRMAALGQTEPCPLSASISLAPGNAHGGAVPPSLTQPLHSSKGPDGAESPGASGGDPGGAAQSTGSAGDDEEEGAGVVERRWSAPARVASNSRACTTRSSSGVGGPGTTRGEVAGAAGSPRPAMLALTPPSSPECSKGAARSERRELVGADPGSGGESAKGSHGRQHGGVERRGLRSLVASLGGKRLGIGT